MKMIPSLMAESKEEPKRCLMKVKEESEKAGLKLNIQNLRSWYLVPSLNANRWGTEETVTGFIFLGSRITADCDCSHEIKQHLLFGRKAMNNLDSILKSRDITLPTKVCLFKAMFFPVLRVPWTSRKRNLSILKEINPEYSLEGLMLKLKHQYFGHLMGCTDSLEKTLMLGLIEGRRRE